MFIRKPALLWYHNHDVAEPQYLRKWSLYWFAWKTEKWIFPRLDIFSLPALERQICFPMNLLKGKFLFLPNYPSKKVYTDHGQKSLESEIRILYQGSIGPEHGLEEIIGLLDQPVAGKKLHLVLKGFISPEYKQQLEEFARKHQVLENVTFIGPSGYKAVIENAFNCHIGIGIHRKADMMNKTLGTASNKIYEYAAAGMPVLLFDNPHFRKHLQQFEWTFFTDCSKSSLIECIGVICSDYAAFSKKARADFENELNFEHFFEKANSYID
jgi:glycosyltransferase involved in cell wall biosynthesis